MSGDYLPSLRGMQSKINLTPESLFLLCLTFKFKLFIIMSNLSLISSVKLYNIL